MSISEFSISTLQYFQNILPVLVDHISYTLSVQQVDHYLQSYRSGKFRKYDYGLNNMRIYGTTEPPEYKISNIIAPIYIYRATEDYLASRRVRLLKFNLVFILLKIQSK